MQQMTRTNPDENVENGKDEKSIIKSTQITLKYAFVLSFICVVVYYAATNQPTEQSTDQTTGQVTDGNQANVFDVFPFGKLIKLACCCYKIDQQETLNDGTSGQPQQSEPQPGPSTQKEDSGVEPPHAVENKSCCCCCRKQVHVPSDIDPDKIKKIVLRPEDDPLIVKACMMICPCVPREYFIVAPIPMIATPDNTQTRNEGQEHAVQEIDRQETQNDGTPGQNQQSKPQPGQSTHVEDSGVAEHADEN